MHGFACMRHAWIFMHAMHGLYDCMAGMLGLHDCTACMACMLGFAWSHGTACLDLHGCMDAWSCMVACLTCMIAWHAWICMVAWHGMLGLAWLHGCLELHGCMFDLYDCMGVLAWLHGMHGMACLDLHACMVGINCRIAWMLGVAWLVACIAWLDLHDCMVGGVPFYLGCRCPLGQAFCLSCSRPPCFPFCTWIQIWL